MLEPSRPHATGWHIGSLLVPFVVASVAGTSAHSMTPFLVILPNAVDTFFTVVRSLSVGRLLQETDGLIDIGVVRRNSSTVEVVVVLWWNRVVMWCWK